MYLTYKYKFINDEAPFFGINNLIKPNEDYSAIYLLFFNFINRRILQNPRIYKTFAQANT